MLTTPEQNGGGPQSPSLGDEAMKLAALGFAVFPLKPGTKVPMHKGWQAEATCGTFDIWEMWQDAPKANIGISTDGLVVLDADVKKGGLESLTRLANLGAWPQTFAVRTQSGGRHVYFKAPAGGAFGNSAKALKDAGFPGIDIRATGGYVVGPGSIVDGRPYVIEHDAPIAELPEWLAERLAAAPQRHAEPGTTIGPVDSPAAVEAARAWLLKAPAAVEGNGGDQKTYEVACRVLDFGVSPDTAADLMAEDWNERCEPPWEWEPLCRKVQNAASYRQDPIGRENPDAADFGTIEYPPNFQPERQVADHGLKFVPASILKDKPIPPREWHVRDLIPAKNVTLLSGDGGLGKSLLALQLACSTALGRPWVGQECCRGRVVFLSAEDDADELHRRLADVLRSEGADFEDLRDLHFVSLAGEDALLATIDRNTKALAPTFRFAELDQQLGEIGPALIVLDTLADLHAGEENNRTHARQFIGMLRGLAIRHSSAVLLLAHPSLAGIQSGSGSSGSTAWNASVRSRLYIERVMDKEYEPNPDARRLTTKKSNYGRAGNEIALTWRDGVFVANAPTVGVDREAASSRAERVFLKMLDAYTEQERHVSASHCSTFAPKVFSEDDASEGCTKRALTAAMNALFTRGVIAIGEHGKGVNTRKHITRTYPAAAGAPQKIPGPGFF